MNITKHLSLLSMIFLLREALLFSQIKKPVDPNTPSISFKEKKSENSYPVLIDFIYDKKIRGNVIFGVRRIGIPGRGGEGTRYIKILNIKSIDFIKWRGKEYQENSYLFKPSIIKITMNDGSSLTLNGNISRLNRVRFLPDGKSSIKNVYSVFYDYYKNKKWVNSGYSERNYPEKNPHRETLVRIEFLKSEKKGLLTGEILKILKK